jgi:hypothetical protein
LPPADLSRSGGNEPDLGEHPPRRDVLVAGRCFECPQPILLARNPAEVSQCGTRHTTTGHALCNAITDLRGPIPKTVQIEATHDLPIFIDEHVKNAGTGLLLGQERAMSLSELLIEIIATVADRRGEVGPVRPLKSEHRWFVIRAKTLQFEHPSNLPCRDVPTTGIKFAREQPERGAARVDFALVAPPATMSLLLLLEPDRPGAEAWTAARPAGEVAGGWWEGQSEPARGPGGAEERRQLLLQ